MVDVRREIGYLQEQILSTFAALSTADAQRMKFLQEFLTGKADAGPRFASTTRETIVLLQGFEYSFLRLMGYILLREQQGHRSPAFQELLQRYRLMEKHLKQVRKAREQQVHRMEKMVKSRGVIRSIGVMASWYQRRFQKSLRQEEDALMLIRAVYGKDEEQLQKIRAALELEGGSRK